MEGNFRLKTSVSCILLSMCAAFPVQADNSGIWQSENQTTGKLNGTPPTAESVSVPVYQGSTKLDPATTTAIVATALPKAFSADTSPEKLYLTNPSDAEGDRFDDIPQLSWLNDVAPDVSLVWAKADKPNEPLNPQPNIALSFCEQNLSGQLVVWPKVDSNSAATLLLHTTSGVPDNGPVSLANTKFPLNVAAAVATPIAASISAAKAKVGETITLTLTVKDCDGNLKAGTPFTVRRGVPTNRQNVANDTGAPVSLGGTVMTDTTTEYKGVTGEGGIATIAVTQNEGIGVKTPLYITATGMSTPLTQDVTFTVITSPDSTLANMWGHMSETFKASNGIVFKRPRLATEVQNPFKSVLESNESWVLVRNNHLETAVEKRGGCGPGGSLNVPTQQNLNSLIDAYPDGVKAKTGLPVSANYHSKTSDSAVVSSRNFLMVNLSNRSTTSDQFVPDPVTVNGFLVMCQQTTNPKITKYKLINPSDMVSVVGFNHGSNSRGTFNAFKGKTVGKQSVKVRLQAVDGSGKGVPYAPGTMTYRYPISRQGNKSGVADMTIVNSTQKTHSIDEMRYYYATADKSGSFEFTLAQNTNGLGSLHDIYIQNDKSDLSERTAQGSMPVIFETITSPDMPDAEFWGYMEDTLTLNGRTFNRPKLFSELPNAGDSYKFASDRLGMQVAENWAMVTSSQAAIGSGGCAADKYPTVADLSALRAEVDFLHVYYLKGGWPAGNGNKGYWTNNPTSITQWMNMLTGGLEYGAQSSLQICAQ
ncbi:TPA: RatA [Escherichia coli]|nr:RatA [Escherichia coli]